MRDVYYLWVVVYLFEDEFLLIASISGCMSSILIINEFILQIEQPELLLRLLRLLRLLSELLQ